MLPPGNIAPGLITNWHMDEVSGTNVADSSGSNNTGTASGTTIVAGKFSNARSFNGVGDAVFGANNTDVFGDTAFTLAAWLRPATLSTSDMGAVSIGNYGIAGADAAIILNMPPGGPGSFGINYAGSPWSIYSAPSLFQANQWSFFVITKTPGPINTTTNLYLNGSPVGATSDGSGTPNIDNRPPIAGALRNYSGIVSNYFNGAIDEVRVYNRALLAAEVQDLYSNSVSIIKY